MNKPYRGSRKSGQAMIETLFVAIFSVVGFFLIFDFLYTACTQVLVEHASARAVRSDTVGFEYLMTLKAARIALVPFSGKRTTKNVADLIEGQSFTDETGADIELAHFPTYLGSSSEEIARGILNYERWDDLTANAHHGDTWSSVDVNFKNVNLTAHRLMEIYKSTPPSPNPSREAKDRSLHARWRIERHCELYLTGKRN